MSNNYKNQNAIWRLVQRKIEIDIVLGKYKVGEKIPSTRELVEIYDIGVSTSQKILNALTADGILDNYQGKGYFVKAGSQEILKKKLMEELTNGFNSYINFACDMNIDKDKLNDIMLNIIDEAYK